VTAFHVRRRWRERTGRRGLPTSCAGPRLRRAAAPPRIERASAQRRHAALAEVHDHEPLAPSTTRRWPCRDRRARRAKPSRLRRRPRTRRRRTRSPEARAAQQTGGERRSPARRPEYGGAIGASARRTLNSSLHSGSSITAAVVRGLDGSRRERTIVRGASWLRATSKRRARSRPRLPLSAVRPWAAPPFRSGSSELVAGRERSVTTASSSLGEDAAPGRAARWNPKRTLGRRRAHGGLDAPRDPRHRDPGGAREARGAPAAAATPGARAPRAR
jgi:hypothetical protein